MYNDAHDIYLDMQVNSATPQKLRLMLLDGAIRFARQTQELWGERDFDAALEALIRCREIVGELLSGVHTDESPLARQVGGLYVYLFSALVEVQQTRDAQQLAAILGVLASERDTWRQVCEQLGDRPTAPAASVLATREELAPMLLSSPAAFSIDA
ncbi:MAG: flagellar export chaperone FliS [Pirellulaceae bacterium]